MKVKIKSNYARSLIVTLGDVNVSFDKDGVGTVEDHDLPAVMAYANLRPGRFWVLEEAKAVVEELKVEEVNKEVPNGLSFADKKETVEVSKPDGKKKHFKDGDKK